MVLSLLTFKLLFLRELTTDGRARVAKNIIEAIDDEKNLISFRATEGDAMDHFKSFLTTIQANPKPDGGEGCVVHLTMEYEKHHGEIIDPHTLLEFAVEVSKDIEVHLLTENTVITSNNLCGKIETDIEIKASPTQFHHIFRHKPHHLSNVSTGKVHGVELHEGEWGTVGAVVYWHYFHGNLITLSCACLYLVFSRFLIRILRT